MNQKDLSASANSMRYHMHRLFALVQLIRTPALARRRQRLGIEGKRIKLLTHNNIPKQSRGNRKWTEHYPEQESSLGEKEMAGSHAAPNGKGAT